MNASKPSRYLALIGALSLLPTLPTFAQTPKRAPLITRFAAQVNPNKPLPEYPRPQFVRADWLNLNGVWEYQSGSEGDGVPTDRTLTGKIVVPFAVESALSGVMEHHDRLWYRRAFTVPAGWKDKQIILNFGAVDYESEVFVNGKSVGTHQGGYLPFHYDITPYLNANGPQEIIVRVYDPTDAGGQPRGKQTTHPGGIMYTPTTGIWQTVWLEPVSHVSIQNLKIVPDVDASNVHITVNTDGTAPDTKAVLTIRDGKNVVQRLEAAPNTELTLPVANPKLWSPDNPYLYDLDVTLAQNGVTFDRVGSYFGMRKISIGEENGVKKMFLNNHFLFEIGPLDQGFWPDGIYTPPSEAALKSDLQAMKKFGFNMVRKHIKVEPARWYYWTDKLGLLVWQDMPSPNSYLPGNVTPPPVDKAAFESQLQEMVRTLGNTPSIIMWDIYNEGQGQYDTARLVGVVKALDPSRLVNEASGGGYTGSGDVADVHSYPPPASPAPSQTQALACGEYGGIGLFVKGHTWSGEGGGYVTLTDKKSLEELYGEFTGLLKTFRDEKGLSAAVYTQITDVENELNGLLTYDRLFKCDPAQIALANRFQYPISTYREIIPTSETNRQTWKYTTTAPATDWYKSGFNDSGWQSGVGGFGTAGTPGAIVRTNWNTSDIWLRRTFNPVNLTPEQISRLVVREHHDEDVEIYINGVLAYSAGGYTSSYEGKAMSKAARQTIRLNTDNVLAVHCHQTTGGQYIDVGIFERIPPKK